MNTIFIVAVVALVMIGFEIVKTGRSFPKVAGWWTRAGVLNLVQIGIVLAAGLFWDPWFHAHQVWQLDHLPHYQQVVIGYLAITFIYYWWHRWRHESDALWRWFHQVHHSPVRLEIITSFYKHPFEIFANGILSSLILYNLCGLSVEAAVSTTLITGLAELFYHWNVKTPHWLGYIIQRPESHCVHHQEGFHQNNYADLPIWDMLFGTYYNPRESEFSCGFANDKEQELGAMLLGRDVLKEQP